MENAFSKIMVWKWRKQFEKGRTSVHDEARSGCPSIITEEFVDANVKIKSDSRIKIGELCSEAKNSPTYLATHSCELVKGCLGYKKVYVRWVAKMLTPQMGACLKFLKRYHKEGDNFLDRIVTCDETWVCRITPESKQQLMQ